MTSQPRVYRSADPGAPQLAGQFGSLVAVLDAVLVNGYGVGADAKPGAGWTIAFSAVGKRVYRNNAVTGTGTYLRVDDSAGDARIARVRAYEGMTGVDVGVGPAPTPLQSPDGRVWVKSDAASSASRIWEVIATNSCLYFFSSPMLGVSAGFETVALTPCFAGDIDSFREGDASRFMLIDNAYTGYSASFIVGFTEPRSGWGTEAVMSSPPVGNLMRSHTQAFGAVGAGVSSTSGGTAAALGGFGAPFPDPVSGGLLFDRALVVEGANVIRGALPGVFVPLHNRPFVDGQVVTGLVGLPGITVRAKTFYSAVGSNLVTNAGRVGQFLFNMTDPW